MSCDGYSAASVRWIVAGSAMIGSLITLIILAFAYFLHRKSLLKLRLAALDPAFVHSGPKYAFDNPYFKDDESPFTNQGTPKNNWSSNYDWPSPEVAHQKFHSVNDLTNNSQFSGKKDVGEVNVELKGRDIIGLGFDICGNMKDGIFVRKVLNKGPANDSGLIRPGDKIVCLKIPFDQIVLEDAVQLLNYASPYKIELTIAEDAKNRFISGDRANIPSSSSKSSSHKFELCYKSNHPNNEKCFLQHPLYRSRSTNDLKSIQTNSYQNGLSNPKRKLEFTENRVSSRTFGVQLYSDHDYQYGGVFKKIKNQLNAVRKDALQPLEKLWNSRHNRNKSEQFVGASKKQLELDAIVIGNNLFAEDLANVSEINGSMTASGNRRPTIGHNSVHVSNHSVNSFAYHNAAMEYSPEMQPRHFGSNIFSTSVDNRSTAFPNAHPKRADFFVPSNIDERLTNLNNHSQWTLNTMPNKINGSIDFLSNSGTQSFRKVSI